MKRAYSVLTVKAMDDKKRTFTGIATTPSTDMMGDIIEPKGLEFDLPLPLLWQHDSRNPIGWVRKARVTSEGVEVECEVASVEEDGDLKRRLADYWSMLRAGLVRGLSIGFNAIEAARIEGTYGYRYLKAKLLELSCVTIAANSDCSITTIKSLDEQQRAALGPPVDRTRPGASGHQQRAASGRLSSFNRSPKGNTMKTLQELLDLQATLLARQTEITKAWDDKDHVRTAEERDELDTIDADLDTLGDDIRIARMHARHAGAAREVRGANSDEGSRSRVPGGMSFVKKEDPDDKFKGQSHVRFLKLKALARITQEPIAKLMEYHGFHKTHPKFAMYVKAAVAGGGTGSGEWGAELARLDATYTGDFIEFLYGQTVFDRLPLKGVPARVRVKGQDGAFTGYWVGESKAIPPSAGDYSNVDLTPLKVAALAVISNDLIEDSSPSADSLVMDGLSEAHSQKVDSTFLSTAAASAGVSPAGMLNGLSALAPSGTDEAAVRADMQALAYPFVTAKMASGLMFVMNPAQGLSLGSFVNTFSQPAFPGINENGGMFLGRPVLTGDNVTPGDIILLRPKDIWKIGDGGVQVSMSDVATIEMNDAAAGASDTPVAMASHAVSMFQTESTAFKLVRRINFQKRRTGAVQVLSNAEYGGVTS